MDNGNSSTGKKIAIGAIVVVVVAVIAVVVFVFLKPGASNNGNDNANTNATVENTNVAVSNANNQNASNATITTPGTSTSQNPTNTETPASNENANGVVSGDLTESTTSTAGADAAQRQEEIDTYKRIAENIHRDENGNYRSVGTDERTDLDRAMLEANSKEFVNTLFFEKDKWRRTQVMNKLVDIDYVREDNPTSLNYDWKTGWEYSLVRDDNLQYTAANFLEVESAYVGGASCLFDISYMRSHQGDHGGEMQQFVVTDVYRVTLSDTGKIRNIEYVATRSQQ